MHGADPSTTFEATISHWIKVVGNGIEAFGVLVIVIGIVWSSVRYLRRPSTEPAYDIYKIRIGRSGSKCWSRPISSTRLHSN